VWSADAVDLLVSGWKGGGERDERVDDGTTHEIRIIFAEDEVSSILIYSIADIEVPYERRAEERGDIGVIHSIRCLCLAPILHLGRDFILDPKPSTSNA
jgi:hypothetical protein